MEQTLEQRITALEQQVREMQEKLTHEKIAEEIGKIFSEQFNSFWKSTHDTLESLPMKPQQP